MTDITNNQMFTSPIDKRIVEVIVKKYFERLDKPYPNKMVIKYNKAQFLGGWMYPVTYMSGATKLSSDLMIKEYDGGFAIGVIPEYYLRIKAHAPIIGLTDNDAFVDAENSEERFWDHFNNQPPVPMNEEIFMATDVNEELTNHKRNVRFAVLEWCVSQPGMTPPEAEELILNWYIKEVEIPIMSDSSTGDLVHMFRNGFPGIDLDVVLDFINNETDPEEGSTTLTEFIPKMDKEIKAYAR